MKKGKLACDLGINNKFPFRTQPLTGVEDEGKEIFFVWTGPKVNDHN
jgi:hypothetical protein